MIPAVIWAASSYFVVAIVAASLGLLGGGILSSGKVSDLYNRVDHIERAFLDQAALMSELSGSMARLLSDLERNPGNSVSPDNIQSATRVLERVRKVSPLENMLD